MFSKAKIFAENNYTLILLMASLLGLGIPGIQDAPNSLFNILLAIVMFVAFLQPNASMKRELNIPRVISFYVLRFIALPIGLFCLTSVYLPAYSESVFVFSLLPAGMLAFTFTGFLQGDTLLSLSIILLSSLLAPIIIPVSLLLFTGSLVKVALAGIEITLLSTVVGPFILALPLRNDKIVKRISADYGRLISVITVAVLIAIVFGRQRDLIFSNYQSIVPLLLISSIALAIFYLCGYSFAVFFSKREKVPYTVSSGFNNIVLGIGISLSYLPPQISLFLAISEYASLTAISLFKMFVNASNRAILEGAVTSQD